MGASRRKMIDKTFYVTPFQNTNTAAATRKNALAVQTHANTLRTIRKLGSKTKKEHISRNLHAK